MSYVYMPSQIFLSSSLAGLPQKRYGCCKVFLELSLLQAKQAQFSPVCLYRRGFPALWSSPWTLLNSLQHLHMLLTLVTPELHTKLQVMFHKCAVEENHPLNLLATLPVTQPRTQLAFRIVSTNKNTKPASGDVTWYIWLPLLTDVLLDNLNLHPSTKSHFLPLQTGFVL